MSMFTTDLQLQLSLTLFLGLSCTRRNLMFPILGFLDVLPMCISRRTRERDSVLILRSVSSLDILRSIRLGCSITPLPESRSSAKMLSLMKGTFLGFLENLMFIHFQPWCLLHLLLLSIA